MKASELRIGNLFQEKHSGKVIEVIELTQKSITYSGEFPKLWQAVKIPLTEEWLLKLGAKKSGIEYKLKASALEITIRINAGQVYCEFGNVYLGGRIQYVHELQNLVHSLCGKELEVNP